jgi:hypothetical protein
MLKSSFVMLTKEMVFAGIDISSGRKPLTFVALNGEMKVTLQARWDISEVINYLQQFEHVLLAVNLLGGRKTSSTRSQKISDELKKKIIEAVFKPYLTSNAPRQWVETNPVECFRSLAGQTLLPRRSLGGQLQRALILYEQGLQIADPMDFFEEITRHHVLAGAMPTELLYSASELDAFAAASVAWMLINKPVQVDLTKDLGKGMIVIPREDKDWWRKKPAPAE